MATGWIDGACPSPRSYSADPETRAARSWIYLAYVFSRPTGQTCSTNSGSSNTCLFYTRIVRYTYAGNTLSSPVTILDSIPGSNDHNSGRLTISSDKKL